MRRALVVALLGATFGSPSAFAGGWDTPMLYSAQHMGLGGAAIAYVDDPSSMFHNPAGLARSHGLTLMANATMLVGSITSSPSTAATSVESDTIFSVAPLLGASYRVNDWFAAGASFYPVAAAGATYNYVEGSGERPNIENTTQVTFLEISPGVAFKLPANIRLGFGWRVTLLTLERFFGATEGTNPGDEPNPPAFDGELSGTNLVGFRFGAQWDPIPELQLGIVFRTKTTTEIEDSNSPAILAPVNSAKSDFILPAKLGFGARVNLAPVAVVLDLEYTFQDQNDESIFETDPELPIAVNNVFAWKNSITLRSGVEYGIEDMYFFRAGFLYDSQVNRKEYPSAFGTPPAATTTLTAGFGYKAGPDWKLNAAVAHRFGSTEVDQAEVDAAERGCLACGEGGNYKIGLTGLYVDFVYSFL